MNEPSSPEKPQFLHFYFLRAFLRMYSHIQSRRRDPRLHSLISLSTYIRIPVQWRSLATFVNVPSHTSKKINKRSSAIPQFRMIVPPWTANTFTKDQQKWEENLKRIRRARKYHLSPLLFFAMEYLNQTPHRCTVGATMTWHGGETAHHYPELLFCDIIVHRRHPRQKILETLLLSVKDQIFALKTLGKRRRGTYLCGKFYRFALSQQSPCTLTCDSRIISLIITPWKPCIVRAVVVTVLNCNYCCNRVFRLGKWGQWNSDRHLRSRFLCLFVLSMYDPKAPWWTRRYSRYPYGDQYVKRIRPSKNICPTHARC